DVSWRHIGEAERFWFDLVGTKGSASVQPLRVFKEIHGTVTDLTPTGASGRETPFAQSYRAEWTYFLAVIRGDVNAPPPRDQLALHRVLEAVYRSADEGREVVLWPRATGGPRASSRWVPSCWRGATRRSGFRSCALRPWPRRWSWCGTSRPPATRAPRCAGASGTARRARGWCSTGSWWRSGTSPPCRAWAISRPSPSSGCGTRCSFGSWCACAPTCRRCPC